jgi:hypothetical protein
MTRALSVVGQVLFSGSIFLGATVARGEHAVIKLEVIAPNGRQNSFADHEPPLGGVYPRRQLEVKVGDPLILQFQLTYSNPHKRVNDVAVRYFVVRTRSFAAKTVDFQQGVVLEGTVKMNFKPESRVGTRMKFQVDHPGIYEVRVETQNTDSDHEHFSAIDLDAKP